MSLQRILSGTYALLLRAFPHAHRARYRDEMADVFERELGAVRERAGTMAALRFALRGYLDAVLAGLGERGRVSRAGRSERFELGLARDLAHGARSLARSWGYTLVCLVSLGAGMGVTAAVMLLFRVTMEAPFELDEAGLVEVLPMEAGVLGGAWSYPELTSLSAGVESADLVGWTVREVSLRPDDADAGERVQVGYVSTGYFEALRLDPALGRLLGPQDRTPSGAVPVVVAHGFWKQDLGGDSSAMGRVITLDRTPHVIVGVAPEWFSFHNTRLRMDVWVPLETHPDLAGDRPARHDPAQAWIGILGRLHHGASPVQVEGTARSVISGLEETRAATSEERDVQVLPWHWQGAETMQGDGWFMAVVFGMLCAFLMLVVCLNLAGMAMVRSATRERELAVRLALGSGRRRLVQALMAESLVLAAVGGALVIGVVWVALRVISWRLGVPLPANAQLDAPLIALCMAAALATSLVFGLVPALRFSRPKLLTTIKDDSGTGGRRSGLMHRTVAAVQAGLAVPVLVVAVGVARGAVSIEQVDFGVCEECLVVWTPMELTPDGYDAAAADRLARDVVREVSGLPGVDVAAAADGLPLDWSQRGARVSSPEVGTQATAQLTRVGPGYLEALGVPVLQGRALDEEDVPGAEAVAVITASLAESLYEGDSPLGRRLTLDAAEGEGREVTIVGVAADFASHSVEAAHDHILLSLAQEPSTVLGLAVRTGPSSPAREALAEGIERIVLEIDPGLARPQVLPFASVIEDHSSDFPVWSAFFGLLAALLLLLSASGIYGVVAFTVARRTREIGVRMSLGSSRSDMLRKILWDGARLAAPGLVLGSAAGALVAVAILNRMFVNIGLPLAGVGTLAAAALASLATVLLASLIPARRAASVDPLKALRAE